MANNVKLWRYNKRCEFGHYGAVKNANGTYSENDDSFIPDFKRVCADYYITPTMQNELTGLDLKESRAISVRQLRNDPLMGQDMYSYYVRYQNQLYNIESIKFNTMELVGRIIIVLSKIDKV